VKLDKNPWMKVTMCINNIAISLVIWGWNEGS
jgi:hypothetical protein